MIVKEFYDKTTSTLTYIVHKKCVDSALIIDPVLNYDPISNETSLEQVNELNSYLTAQNIKPSYILETHVHADHLSASHFLKKLYPNVKLAISKNITEVQKIYAKKYSLTSLKTDGSQFDILLEDQQLIQWGDTRISVHFTPGHTPTCITFKIDDSIFTGDVLFSPDLGCGRCDFPGGSAEALFNSVTKRLYKFNDETKIYLGHDYPPPTRPLKFKTTVSEQKLSNKAINSQTTKADFINFRQKRDATLNAPRLLKQSLIVNLNAGSTHLLI